MCPSCFSLNPQDYLGWFFVDATSGHTNCLAPFSNLCGIQDLIEKSGLASPINWNRARFLELAFVISQFFEGFWLAEGPDGNEVWVLRSNQF